MSNQGRPPNEDELSLWRKIADGINPLRKKAGTSSDAKIKPKTAKMDFSPPFSSPFLPKKKPIISSSQNHPVDPNIIKKTGKGKIPVESVLDMHGMFQDEARSALESFVRRCFNANMKCVLVITGKGTNSKADTDIFSSKKDGMGVLKTQLPGWIKQQSLNSMISGHAKAHKKHGGDGAYYLYLKTSRPRIS